MCSNPYAYAYELIGIALILLKYIFCTNGSPTYRQFIEIVVLTSARMFKNIFAGLNGFNPYTIWNRVKLLADEHFY